MSAKGKNLFRIGLAVVFLVGAVLACCPTPAAGAVSVTITSPGDGGTVAVGQEVLIDSTVTAAVGVNRADLSVDGRTVRQDVPPEGNPTTFRVIQPWTPASEGQVTITVAAYNTQGASGQATITLQVVASGAVVPTAGPGSAVPPEPMETPPPVTTEAGCTLDSQYVADVTIPDGTVMSPGAAFVKTWRVRNSGTCDWEAGFQLVFVGGAQMGGAASVALPAVPAGGQADVSVDLTAPSSYGTHKGTWRIRSTDGTVFGTNLTVVIVVPTPVTDTPTLPPPTDAPTLPPPTDTPTLPPPTDTISPPFTQYVTSKVTLAAGSDDYAVATCPAGSVVVGGGYDATDPDVTFYVQYKYGNGWRGYAKNNSGSSRQITVFAVCLHNAPGASVTQELAQAMLYPGSSTPAIADCPPGSIVTGGGFYVDPDADLQVYQARKSPTSEGWMVWAYNHSGSDKTFLAYAMCLSGSGGTITQIEKTVDISAGTTGYALPTCGGGSLLTGGGFSGPLDLIVYRNSSPYSGGQWQVYAKNTHTSDTKKLYAYVICLSLP